MLSRTLLATSLSPRPPWPPSRRPRPPPAAARCPDDHDDHDDERLPHQRPRPGHHRAGPDLLLALPPAPAPPGRHPVPMVLHSHGWGGSRRPTPPAFTPFLDDGYAVLSFDQRGFGESGGHAYVENPRVEGHDVRKLVRAGQPAAAGCSRTAPATRGWARSAAATAAATSSSPPSRSMRAHRQAGPRRDGAGDHLERPQRQPRPAGRGAHRVGGRAQRRRASRPTRSRRTSTRRWPRASRPAPGRTGRCPAPRTWCRSSAPTARSGSVAHGRRLDIPMLFGQGTTDTLFPLQQGLTNWRTALTRRARRHSIFVGYNGGHVLPAVLPSGTDVASDPCSRQLAGGTFTDLTLRFLDEQLRGEHTGLRGYGRLHLATPDSTCTTVRSPPREHDVRRRHGRHHRDRRRPARLRRGRGPRPGRRHAVPHRHAHRPRRHQPRLLRARGRHQPRGRPPGAEQRAADRRDPAGRRRAAPHRRSRRSRSTCRPGRRSTCSPRRSATRSSAWAAGRRAPCSSRTRSSTSPWRAGERPSLGEVRLRLTISAGLVACALTAGAPALAGIPDPPHGTRVRALFRALRGPRREPCPGRAPQAPPQAQLRGRAGCDRGAARHDVLADGPGQQGQLAGRARREVHALEPDRAPGARSSRTC